LDMPVQNGTLVAPVGGAGAAGCALATVREQKQRRTPSAIRGEVIRES
jgi:hypothetical protein